MERFCHQQGYSGRTDPQVLVERMKPHLLGSSPGTTAGKSFAATVFADELRMHTDHLRAFDHRIAQLLDQHPDAPIFLSFTGIGPVVAAVLIAEMGDDRARFPTVEVLLAETGLAPVTKASGRTRQVRFRYAANRRMRHAIDLWMFIAAREDPWSKNIYDAGRARGQGTYRALRGLGARGVRILWRCWTDHTCYDPTRHHPPELTAAQHPGSGVPAQRRHPQPGSRLAAGHPKGSGLDHGEDAATLRHARTTDGAPPPRLTAGVCCVHLIRNTFRCASRKYWDKISNDLRPIYTAPTATDARRAYEEFAAKWGRAYPATKTLWDNAWAEFIPFLDYDVEIRRVICSTNAIESLNARYRRAVRARGHFPTEQDAPKCLYLVTRALDPT